MTTPNAPHLDPGYRKALMLCAVLNLIMFVSEGAIGLRIGSAALIADAADFLEDASGYSLAVLAIGWSVRNRAIAGFLMGLAMCGVGVVALWQVYVRVTEGGVPTSLPMAATAAAALAVNVYCAYRLVRYRRGDAGMRSIWLSTRNDALLNMLTIVAAVFVFFTATAWPDIITGLIIAAVNIWASLEILQQAWREMQAAPA